MRTQQTLAPEWQRWLAENLVDGASPDVVHEALRSQGVPEQVAAAQVAQTLRCPRFAVARQARRDARRYAQVLLLRRQQQQQHLRANPGAVERVDALSGRDFSERYYATSTPVVLPDFMQGWPALERLTPDYFATQYGHVEVDVCEGRHAEPNYVRRSLTGISR